MPGLMPGIHVFAFLSGEKDMDGRGKPGHDEKSTSALTVRRFRTCTISHRSPACSAAR
jgi:hypothetical protein